MKIHVLVLFVVLFVSRDLELTAGQQNEPVEYILDLPHCKIPEVPLDNEAIMPEWNVTFDEIPCNPELDLSTLTEEGTLSLTKYAKKNFMECCYTKINRPKALISDTYELSECQKFQKSVVLDEQEFVFVTCRRENETELRKVVEMKLKGKPLPPPRHEMKYHSQLRIKSEIQEKLDYWKQFEDDEKPPSVMIVIIDSLTMTHGFRALPKLMKYLNEEMDFINFKGHHVMGEPTVENEVPMMLGTITSDWEMKKPHYKGKYDDRPFIWQNFSASNYITMDNEDSPLWHTFNFNGRQGFTYKPFDYYLRPYYLAQYNINGRKTKKTMHISHTQRQTGTVSFNYAPQVCMESQPIYKFLFDYTWRFLNVVSPKDAPSFSISFLGWPQHDYLASFRLLDDPLLDLMTKIKKTPDIYDNTVIFFLGDHGFRWANYSDTQEGLLERDLPLMSIRIPEKFAKKFPKYAKNLKQNADRVTSHLDIFKTLAHLHKISGEKYGEKKKNENARYGYERDYGRSLFKKIPIERTCDDAKISERFCACNYPLYSDEWDWNKYSKVKAIEGLSAVGAGRRRRR